MTEPLGAKLYPLLFVAGVLCVLFFTGKISIPWSYAESEDPAAKAQEINALVQATNSSDSVVATQSVFALLDTAERAGRARGAHLIREQLPALAARIDADAPNLPERLSAVDVRTSEGRECRTALLRLNAEKRWFLHTFAEDIARSRSTWRVVHGFRARWHRWVVAQRTICNFNL
jgi:hypothetical protein